MLGIVLRLFLVCEYVCTIPPYSTPYRVSLSVRGSYELLSNERRTFKSHHSRETTATRPVICSGVLPDEDKKSLGGLPMA